MKKILKNYTVASLKSIVWMVAGIALMAGTIALAYTAPTATAPGGNVPAPVNTGTVAQTKSGDLTVGLVGSLTKLISNGLFFGNAGVMSQGLASKFGSFTDDPANSFYQFYNNANAWRLEAGKTASGIFSKGLIVDKDANVMVVGSDDSAATLPMLKIENTGPNTKLMNLFQVKSNQGGLSVFSRGGLSTFTDTAASVTQVNGNLSVDKEIYIHGGNPAAGKVLVSKDAGGTAAWGDVTTSNTASGLIYTKRYTGGNGWAKVSCDNQDIAISGGGYCQYGIKISEPITNGSANNDGSHGAPNGWSLECLRTDATKTISGVGQGTQGFAQTEVICMKNTSLVTSIVATAGNTSGGNTGGTGGGTAQNPDWYLSAGGMGTIGESCRAWVARTNPGKNITDLNTDYKNTGIGYTWLHTQTSSTEYCAYAYTDAAGNPVQHAGAASASTKTYCVMSNAAAAPTVVENGQTYTARPVDSCSDLSATSNGSATTVTAKTWLFY